MDSKYKYTYERTANYCYKDTDVLINKLNITNDEDLYNAERELVSYRKDVYDISKGTSKEDELFEYASIPSYFKEYQEDEEKNKDDFDLSL